MGDYTGVNKVFRDPGCESNPLGTWIVMILGQSHGAS